jgi:hypothetical protein
MLGNIMLDPQKTADLFKVGKRDSAFKSFNNSALNKIPGLFGYLLANQYAD